jgi:hypothetical protein
MLTRLLALERMEKLSDAYIEAASNYDPASMRAIDEERKDIKKQYFKVVK